MSGDHPETAKAVARKAGIIKEGEDHRYTVMVAEDFRSVVGSLQQLDESTLTLENIDAF